MAKDLIEVLGLESLDSLAPPSFPDLLQRIYAAKYTGKVVLDFAGGVPRQVEFPQPVRLPLEVRKPGT